MHISGCPVGLSAHVSTCVRPGVKQKRSFSLFFEVFSQPENDLKVFKCSSRGAIYAEDEDSAQSADAFSSQRFMELATM